MPPEPLPWDNNRRGGGEFRRQQHDRSGSDPRGFGFESSSQHRWRENYHHNQNYHHGHNHHGPLRHAPSPSSYNYQQQQRWYLDSRNSRPLHNPYPGHGRQGGWHTHPDGAANGNFVSLGSRYVDRRLEDENCPSFGAHGADGRYFRNSRDNRGSFVQREWRTPSCEPAASPSGPGRPNTEVNSLRFSENTRMLHDNRSKSSDASRPRADAMNSSGQSQVFATEQLSINGGQNCATQRLEKRDGLGLLDCKPLKWSRSGSITPRGSGLIQSSFSKSIGVESIDTVADVQVKNILMIQSPSADVAAHAISTVASAPPDEIDSRKKPRLGWGEGLAKYEKKRVDGPEDVTTSDGLAVGIVREENMQSVVVSVPETSPRVASLSDRPSPATPSFACSSSPGGMGKESIKKANIERDTTNFSCSPRIVSPTNCNGTLFDLESFDPTSIADLSSSIGELLRSDNQSDAETGSSLINKLMVWKDDILKALEITDSEIDALETELKSFGPETRSDCPFAAGFGSQPVECPLKACDKSCSASHFVCKAISLQIVPSGDKVIGNAVIAVEHKPVFSNDDDFDSLTSATSKFVELRPDGDGTFPCETGEWVGDCVDSNNRSFSCLDEKCLNNGFNNEKMTGVDDHHALHVVNTCEELESVSNMHLLNAKYFYDAIITSNKEFAGKAWEELNNLLPAVNVSAASDLSCFPRSLLVMKDKYLVRKRFLLFKEKVLAIKFRIFRHFWKQGRVVSVKKLRLKAHKKYSLSLTGLKKKRSSSRFRTLSPAGGPQTVSTSEVIEYVKYLLLHWPVKPCRNTLKMPALILDKEMTTPRFISTNCLVEDPCAVENERSMMNLWTIEEKEIFMDKLSVFGKDFGKIASFLDRKTTADCIEFYYKNHKSDIFEKVRKKPESMKQRKSQPTTYLITSGKKWNRESNTASLDILGAASAIASASGNDVWGIQGRKKYASSFVFPAAKTSEALRNVGLFRRSHSPELYNYEREAIAADVLAEICGSFSSEAVSSSITGSVNLRDGSLEGSCRHNIRSSMRHPLTPGVVDDEWSDESFGEVDSGDWTDEEKSVFIHALSSYGKDFTMISQCIGTRSRDQCNVFYSKARARLGLDLIHPGSRNCADVYGSGDDSDDANAMESGSIICNNGSESMMLGGDFPSYNVTLNHESETVGTASHLMPDSNACETNEPDLINFLTSVPVDELKGCSHVRVKAFRDLKVDGNEQNAEEINSSLPNGLCEATVNMSVEATEANSEGEIGSSFGGVSEVKSGPNPAGNTSQSSEEVHSSVRDLSKPKIGESGEKSRSDLLQQMGHLESMKSLTLFSVPIKYQKCFDCDALSVVGTNKIRSSPKIIMENDSDQQPPFCSLSDSIDSSQIIKGYPFSVQSVKTMSGKDVNCKSAAPHKNLSNQDEKFRSDKEFFLRKCKGKAALFLTPELSRRSTPEVDKSSSSNGGDVKLFGKILVSSQHKMSSRERDRDGKSLNLNRNVVDSPKLKIDRNPYDYLGSENIPLGSSGFLNAAHMKIGYPPLSDSACLLAKYPAAFSNYPMSTVKLGQCQLNGTITRFDTGVSVLSNKETSNSGIGNYPLLINNGDLRYPFVVDMHHRKNQFDGMRQEARGNYVDAQCCPVVLSDPVAAIKMHFANQTDYNVNKRTNNGDVGR